MEKNSPKLPEYFVCNLCNYKCSHKGDWKKHLATLKHKMITNGNKNSREHVCECGKKYIYLSGLSRHKNVCNFINKKIEVKDESKDESAKLILKVLEENKDLRKMLVEQQETHHKEMMDIIPKIGNNNTTNKFNLNIFLNEQCSEAVNLDDFIKTIQVNMKDLEYLMETNITNSITNVLCNEINELGIYKRPIHCIDSKRRKICIKNENSWNYNCDENKETINKFNRQIHHKHILQLQNWQNDNPNWEEDDKKKDIYIQLTQKVMEDINSEKCLNELAKQINIPK